MSDSKVVLITGAASGFGLLTAKALLERGHRVAATMREPEGRHAGAVDELRSVADACDGTLHALALDVTDDASVEGAVAGVLERLERIDVAINNAGRGMSGFAEAFTAEEMRRLFEINLFGAQRVNRAVLPSMRAAGRGLLIHVSSTFGRFVVPFVAPYTASKWALEALAESYAQELAGTGVGVAIVEPGAFPTEHVTRIDAPADEQRVESYGDLAEAPGPMWGDFVARMEAAAPDPQAVATTLADLVEAPLGNLPLRHVVDQVTGGGGVESYNRAADHSRGEFFDALGIADSVPVSRRKNEAGE